MFVERTGRIDQMDRSADVDFRQLQGDEAIVCEALEMAVEHHVHQLGDRPGHLRTGESCCPNWKQGVRFLVAGG
jgi:hypothetical protein